MVSTTYLIIGNSAAGINAAENIRKIDKNGKITILTYEKYANYSKPLITYYLAGKLGLDRINFKDKGFYKNNNIDLVLRSRAKWIDFKNNVVKTTREDYRYKKLLIATGGQPVLPGINIEDENGNTFTLNRKVLHGISGIFTLTTLEDAVKLKKYIEDNDIKNASILGGGLIGLKAAEAFLELGLDINVIELSDRILAATFDREASAILESEISGKGSSIYTNNTIRKIEIGNGRVKRIILRNGKKIDCSLLVTAVGVSPNLSFFDNSLIDIGRGIRVNDRLQTNIENVYAAGDVIESRDILLNSHRNIAIWPLAVSQGYIAGMNLAGANSKYAGSFFMNSVEILKVPSISMGLTNVEDNGGIEVLKEYRPDDNYYRKIVIRDKKVVGAILIGGIERAGIYSGLIKNKIDISKEKDLIVREDFGLIQLPSGYKKHLVVGEGIEV